MTSLLLHFLGGMSVKWALIEYGLLSSAIFTQIKGAKYTLCWTKTRVTVDYGKLVDWCRQINEIGFS